ncbi:MAG: transcriptional regulator, Fis family [Bryobacterales bacterium]|jgi:RNA polymerase sigma-70 factor (ECF subfamily)|nr:transcriptional regulator, Fis family [Bryobacterales bacterium]
MQGILDALPVSSNGRTGNTHQMDESIVRQAFEEHKDAVYAFAWRMTNCTAAADDLTQDCFVELFRQSNSFNPARGNLRNYLLGVTRNLALKRWRKENRFLAFDDDFAHAAALDGLADTALAVAAAIQSLSPLQREVIILFEYEGLTLQEIAAITEGETGTVKSRLYRARENLRRALASFRPVNRGF